jgi:spore photoproduct lyase
MYSKARTFAHIYVEEAVRDHPRTRRILGRFSSSRVVIVDDYQNVFGRGKQDFWRQKPGAPLVLARKKDNFLYSGNEYLQASQSPNFSYNALVLNCPYDCHYCYLQGMYPGASIVAFVNLEDYFSAASTGIRLRAEPAEPLQLAVSYDTDLLALEGVLGYAREWTDWARHQPDVLLEIRTKSAPVRFLKEVPPTRSVRIAWTLSPEPVANRYETGAPALEARLNALRQAAEAGWRISLCIDPVLRLPGWRATYGEFIDSLEHNLPWTAIERIEVGVFRVGSGFFKRMQRRPDTDLLHYPYEHAIKMVSYNEEEREELVGFVYSRLLKMISKDSISIWT